MSKIIKSDDCRTASQKSREDVRMSFALDDEGVLTIYGNDFVLAEIIENECDEPYLVSRFKDLDFHTAIIMPEVLGLGDSCFSGCDSLREVIVDASGLYLHTKFVDASQDVQVNENNLMPAFIEYQMWHSPDSLTD